jgi:hypothetical protein
MSGQGSALAEKAEDILFVDPGMDNTATNNVQHIEFEVVSHGTKIEVVGQQSEPVLRTNDAEGITTEDGQEGNSKRGFRFWCIMVALASTSVLSALEGTIVSTALPTIVDHLGGAELYI